MIIVIKNKLCSRAHYQGPVDNSVCNKSDVGGSQTGSQAVGSFCMGLDEDSQVCV